MKKERKFFGREGEWHCSYPSWILARVELEKSRVKPGPVNAKGSNGDIIYPECTCNFTAIKMRFHFDFASKGGL